MNTTRRTSRSAFTLIEIMIVTAILAIVLGAIYTVSMASANAYTSGANLESLQANVRILLDDMAAELRQASAATLSAVGNHTDGTGDQLLSFKVVLANGVTSSSITYSSMSTDGETAANGLDDNRDGLIDERAVTRTGPVFIPGTSPNPTTEQYILGGPGYTNIPKNKYLQSGSLKFTVTITPIGSITRTNVRISLTLARLDHRQKVITASGSVSVDIRNP